MRWRIYYGDGTTYGDQEPQLAPALNVQAVAQADAVVGRYIFSRYDFYWFDRDRWWGGDIFGLWDYLQRPGWKRVLFGRSLTNEQWNKVLKQVLEDPKLPAKSAWDDKEHRPEGDA